MLSKEQLEKVKKKIKEIYNMNRLPTDQEVEAEIVNLQRRDKLGVMDDRHEAIFAMLK